MRPLFGLFPLLLCLLAGSAWAGEMHGDTYVGKRYGTIEIKVPAGTWVVLDREANGENDFGGPVADFKSTVPIAGIYPAVHLSAFRRVDASITPSFVLQTSLDAVALKGGVPGAVLDGAVNGRKSWFFIADVVQQNRPAKLYFVLLEGREAIFSAQTVVPPEALAETRQQVDAFLQGMRY
jgi:hypothetical protein